MKTWLRGGSIVDGTGAPASTGDLLIEGDRIAAVGSIDPSQRKDANPVDCKGFVVAPGFIDLHTHYDAQIFWDPDLSPSSWHGVTTVVMGNCGFGIAPTRAQDRGTILRILENVEGMPLEALEAGIPWGFETFPEYLAAVEDLPLRIHAAAYVGHTPVRQYVMHEAASERAATRKEIEAMQEIVGDALEAGAIGFSTSHAASHVGAHGRPVPSRLAELPEIWALAGELGRRGMGVVEATWGPDLFVEEFDQLATEIRRPITWAALMATRRDPAYAPDVIARSARGAGHVYPQIAGRPIMVQIMLSDPGPFANVPSFVEVLALPASERAAKYRDRNWRARADAEIRASWGDIVDHARVSESRIHADLVGGSQLHTLAAQRNTSAFDLMIDLSLEEELGTRFHVPMTNDNEEQIGAMLNDDSLLLGLSDAGAHTTQLCDADFATWLLQHWWREQRALSLEKAIWRLTAQPADFLGLEDRGRLRPGSIADVVVFDPERVGTQPAERVHDQPAGADRLIVRSTGIEHVFVAGTPTRRFGEDLALSPEHAPGRLLRSKQRSSSH